MNLSFEREIRDIQEIFVLINHAWSKYRIITFYRRKGKWYYGETFVASSEKVDEHIQNIYKSGKKCEVSKSSKYLKWEETIIQICRNCLRQTSETLHVGTAHGGRLVILGGRKSI